MTSIEISIYTIGKFLDMDTMYNDLKRHVNRSNYSARLVHKNKGGQLMMLLKNR
jgi:hypothetical protein